MNKDKDTNIFNIGALAKDLLKDADWEFMTKTLLSISIWTFMGSCLFKDYLINKPITNNPKKIYGTITNIKKKNNKYLLTLDLEKKIILDKSTSWGLYENKLKFYSNIKKYKIGDQVYISGFQDKEFNNFYGTSIDLLTKETVVQK